MALAELHFYIVSYDIMDVKRLRTVHERMMGFGDPIHYSVFGCRLTRRGRVELKAALLEIMDPDKDRIMIIDMGPAEGWMEDRIEFLGVTPPGPVKRKYIIV
jgi:CRISPR-associated protein Cas2